jgi:hypothetical protein
MARWFFIGLFVMSLTTLVNLSVNTRFLTFPRPQSDSITVWVSVCTAVISAIGTISTIILAWRSDRRDAREKELKIAQLERELEAAKEQPANPAPVITPKKSHKKVR